MKSIWRCRLLSLIRRYGKSVYASSGLLRTESLLAMINDGPTVNVFVILLFGQLDKEKLADNRQQPKPCPYMVMSTENSIRLLLL